MSCGGGTARAGEAIVREEAATARRKAPSREVQARNIPAHLSLLSHSCLLLVPALGERQLEASRRENTGRRT